jgi:predicted RNA-binding protein
MGYWIFSTTSDGFEIVKAKNIWAVDERAGKWVVNKVKPDDVLIFYVIKTGQFQGVYRATGSWYRSDNLVWPEEQAEGKKTAPNEVGLEPIALGNANVKEMRDQLEFIKKKDRRWGNILMGTPANFKRPITQRDYELILDAVKKSASTLAKFVTYEPSVSKEVSVTVTPESLHDQLVMTMLRLGEVFGYESEKGVPLYKINSRTPPEQRNRSVDVVWKRKGAYSQCVPIEVQAHGSIDALIRRLKLLEPRAWRMIVVGSEQDLKSVLSDVDYSESRAFCEKLIYVPQEKVLETKDHVPAVNDFREFLRMCSSGDLPGSL